MHTGKTDTKAMKIKPNQKDKSLVAKTHRPPSIQSITHTHYVPTKKRKRTGSILLNGSKAESGLLRTSITLNYTQRYCIWPYWLKCWIAFAKKAGNPAISNGLWLALRSLKPELDRRSLKFYEMQKNKVAQCS